MVFVHFDEFFRRKQKHFTLVWATVKLAIHFLYFTFWVYFTSVFVKHTTKYKTLTIQISYSMRNSCFINAAKKLLRNYLTFPAIHFFLHFANVSVYFAIRVELALHNFKWLDWPSRTPIEIYSVKTFCLTYTTFEYKGLQPSNLVGRGCFGRVIFIFIHF